MRIQGFAPCLPAERDEKPKYVYKPYKEPLEYRIQYGWFAKYRPIWKRHPIVRAILMPIVCTTYAFLAGGWCGMISMLGIYKLLKMSLEFIALAMRSR